MDPRQRSLILMGAPNVGKSTFLNAVTRASVDVAEVPGQPEKVIYWGKTSYSYMQWQVLDVRALVNDGELGTATGQFFDEFRDAAVLFFIDLSEECGATVTEQVDLLCRLHPIFEKEKQLVVALSKSDVRKLADLPQATQTFLTESFKQTGAAAVCSLLADPSSSEGPNVLLKVACDLVLEARRERMMRR
jgi:nucleolar GTP-binding protein